MIPTTRKMKIPPRLRAVLVGGVTTLACSSQAGPSSPDGGSDSSSVPDVASPRDAATDVSAHFDGGPCKIHVPPGKVCETTCYDIYKTPLAPEACQVYCTPPDAGANGSCSCNGGFYPEGAAFCPGGLNCDLYVYGDGGTQVLC